MEKNLEDRVKIAEIMTFKELTDKYEDIDDVLDNNDEKILLENGSVSFCIDEYNILNIEFIVLEKNALNSIIKITNIELI